MSNESQTKEAAQLFNLQTVSRERPCPYTIKLLFSTSSSSTFLIRERDDFGEFPNIYTKLFFEPVKRIPVLVLLSDTGTGLNLSKDGPGEAVNAANDRYLPFSEPWNIATFLRQTINPNHNAPYLILTTHCHYDHIRGIQHLLNAKVKMTVLASSYDKDFLVPWHNLQKHSLCKSLGLTAPRYDARWVEDGEKIVYSSSSLKTSQTQTSITVIHTPGHTPDSISWYDHESNALCVGDMFYEKESDESRSGSDGHWHREPPQPVIFNRDSSIIQWNASMHRLLDFVRHENRRLGTDASEASSSSVQNSLDQGIKLEEAEEDGWMVVNTVPSRRRVILCASHVTVGTDAEFALLDMLAFMLRIQLDQVPRFKTHDQYGDHDVWYWDDSLRQGEHVARRGCRLSDCQYSVRAPWSVIHRTST